MGFTAIWITPVTEQLPQSTADGEAYHGYWQQDMYVLHSRCIELRLTLEKQLLHKFELRYSRRLASFGYGSP
jgi:hypothetical protein